MKDSTLMQSSGECVLDAPGKPCPVSPVVSAPATLADALDRLDVEMARRTRAEEALRETEERFRHLSEWTGRFLWISDPETEELLYVSPGYEKVWARTRENSYASPDHWITSFKRQGLVRGSEREARQEQVYQVAGPDGEARWIRDRMFPIRDAAGNVQRILGIAEDITEAKRTNESLARSTAQTKTLLAILPDMLFRVRRDGTVLEFNAGKDNALLVAEEALVGKNIKQLLPGGLAAEALQHITAALRTRQVQTFGSQFLMPDELRDFEARAMACVEDEVMIIIRDVTERKRMEREIVEATSREQQRIGQDLHDGLGQHLTAITFMTKVLERKLSAKAPEESSDAAEIGRLVIQALAQTRNLARGLFPAQLEQNGLIAALSELTAGVEKSCAVRCVLRAHEAVTLQDNVLATHVFRIAQEAINNSIKHGKPETIEVSLAMNGDKIELRVTDDGGGFSPEAKSDGLGLRIMHYRARRIGGTLQVAATDHGGTRVTCLFRNKYESN
jgi:PAS domain S-box-containing protein